MADLKALWLDYTNWNGDRRLRNVIPTKLVFGATEYHPQQQWLLEVIDLEDRHIIKLFAMKDIHAMNADREQLVAKKVVLTAPPIDPNNVGQI